MSIVPLHTHSMYSSLDGFSTPDEIAQRVSDLGCPCCGLTDHGVITGHLPFAKALKDKGIKPVFGCELYHGLVTDPKKRDQAHLVALAMTQQGLANLWSLVNCTSDYAHFYNVGRVFWDDLAKYSEGLVITSACAAGLVPQSILRDDYEPLNRYLEIFGDNFYIELHTYPFNKRFTDTDTDDWVDMRVINEALVSIAMERGLPVVYANDAHYAFPNQYPFHDLYLASQTKQDIYTPIDERKMWHPEGALSIMDEETVRQSLSYLPDSVVDEALANSLAIGERADATLPGFARHLPAFIPSECPWLEAKQQSLSPEELFIDLVEDGIVERYGEDASSEVWDRAIYETETLIRDGIHHYFLMGWDEMMAAIDKDIETGPGRGSSAGSIVAYAMRITDVDPLHYGLIFERFWNSGRAKGFPDIDSDFSRYKRAEMIAYLEERWGSNRVCAIGTTGYMKPKAVIDKLRGGCGMTYEEADELKKIVGQTTKIDILGHKQIGWDPKLEPGKVYYVKNECGNEIEQWIKSVPPRSELRRTFVDMCEICCSRVEQYGIHASGIVVSDTDLPPLAPAYRRGGRDGKPATMFAMEDIDKLGLIKLDVLGLRTLDVLEFWRQQMRDTHGIDIKWSGLDLEQHPDEMWDMLRDGYTSGIFQVEDGYGRHLCKGMDPRSVEDLSVIGALNRPGPIQAKTSSGLNIPEEYIVRHKGLSPVTYIHPRIEEVLGPVLNDTYGLFVYQEQIIAYFNSLGYTLSESDAMRKIMGKKQPQDLAAIHEGTGEWKGKSYMQMAERMDIPEAPAQETWDTIMGFADYCFNKSHTVAYAIIGFRTLFAKYYGAAEFYAASMRSLDPSTDGEKRKAMIPQYINECRRLGINVYPPSVSKSRPYASATDGDLYFGFYDVKGVGHSGPYIEELARSGDVDMATAHSFTESFKKYNDNWLKIKKAKVKSGEWEPKEHKSPKQQLQINKIEALEAVGAWGLNDNLTEQQDAEQEYLGVIVTDNRDEVLERNAEEIAGCDQWSEVVRPFMDKTDNEDRNYFEYTVCGIVTSVSEKRSRKTGQPFGIVTIEMGNESLEMGVYGSKWRSHKFLMKIPTVGVFTLQHSAPTDYGESYKFQSGHVLR